MKELKTTIGLEIHVQLKTKSKMFCRCDNNAEGKAPNTVVCPVCLGLPGALPVANKQAIEWTIKTGLALNSEIPKIAKFDRKHYFYPDLPKGYQISQYDEPFCQGGALEIQDPRPQSQNKMVKIRFNRVHLEEDAGKLIHSNGKSLVDLNRAGTPLMEIVTEPDITSPALAADFLRRLQKIVRDEVKVSDADMEKGHMRCDANISVSAGKVEGGEWKAERMSEIVEIKNLNSFRFVEKALLLEEERLRAEYPNWPEKMKKVTRGYDSKNNKTYLQREKEEAADYRYFPEPDLPPIETSTFDLETMRAETGESLESRLDSYLALEIAASEAGVLVSDAIKDSMFKAILSHTATNNAPALAKAIVHRYFNFDFSNEDNEHVLEYANAVSALAENTISKHQFSQITKLIHDGAHRTFNDALEAVGGSQGTSADEIGSIIKKVLSQNPAEVDRYKAGAKQLMGFFVGQIMREAGGKADPKQVNEILKQELEK